jgi:hypothetical protein
VLARGEQRRCNQQRLRQAAVAEDRIRGRSQCKQAQAGHHPSDELQLQRPAEQSPQPPPVLPLLEAESILDERLLDRQVEHRLEEPGGRDDDCVQTELVRRERVGDDHRPEEAEDDRGVDPSGCRRPAPEEPRTH